MKIHHKLQTALVGILVFMGTISTASERVIIQCRTKHDVVRIAQDGGSFVLYLTQHQKGTIRSPGKLEYLGSAGNRLYTFNSGEMTYRVSDDHVCSTDPFYYNNKNKMCKVIMEKASAGKEPLQEECKPSIRRTPVL